MNFEGEGKVFEKGSGKRIRLQVQYMVDYQMRSLKGGGHDVLPIRAP